MSEPSITIRLDGGGGLQPAETLAGGYWVEGVPTGEVKALELSVLWYTEGKGDEDFAVHDFRRISVDEGDAIDPKLVGRFETVLPHSPLSYEGQIVKIRWCVRVRAFLTRGREVVGEQRFRLGKVPAIKAVPAETPPAPTPAATTPAPPAPSSE